MNLLAARARIFQKFHGQNPRNIAIFGRGGGKWRSPGRKVGVDLADEMYLNLGICREFKITSKGALLGSTG